MKKILYVLMLILLSFSVFAGVSPTVEWLRPGATKINRYSIAVDSQNANFGSTIAATDTYAQGVTYTTVAGDVDNDDEVEILIYDPTSNFIRFLRYELASVVLENEFNLDARINSTVILGDVDSDVYYEIASVLDDSNLTVYSYNGTHINTDCNLAIPGGISNIPALSEEPGTIAQVIVANKTNALYKMVVSYLSVDTCLLQTPESLGAPLFSSIYSARHVAPAIEDLDNDGNNDIVVICDYDNDNNEGICVLDGGNFNPGFFNGGYLDDLGGSITGVVAGIATPNADGSGHDEICVTVYGTAGGAGDGYDSFIWCYNTDGSNWFFKRTYDSSGTASYISNPVIIDVNDDDYEDLCVVTTRSILNTYIQCYNIYNKTSTDTQLVNYESSSIFLQKNAQIAGADVNGDGYGDIIVGDHIALIGAGGSVTMISSGANSYASSSVADVDNDGFLEIMSQWTSNLKISDSNASNEPPVINSSLAYGGFLGWYNSPVCLNTTINFEARDSSAFVSSNYHNDIPSESERIRTDCGGLYSVEQYGAYSSNNPVFSCFYNRTGLYQVYLYLEDGQNVDYTGAVNVQPILINVMDGIPGTTCNIASEYIDTIAEILDLSVSDSSTNAQQSQDIEEMFDIITFGSERLKLVIGVMLIISLVFSLLAYNLRNGLVYAIVIVLMSIINVMLSLFPIYLLLIILVGMLLVILIGKFILNGDSGGD